MNELLLINKDKNYTSRDVVNISQNSFQIACGNRILLICLGIVVCEQ